jgi:hypothetical protein
LLQFAKQRQRNGVVGFETRRKLVAQPGLHLDQGILVTRECDLPDNLASAAANRYKSCSVMR